VGGFQIACDLAGADPTCPNGQMTCQPVGNVCAIIVTSANVVCLTREGWNCSESCSKNCATQMFGVQGAGGSCSTCPAPGSGCGAELCTANVGTC
jgi:hypothetical protein